MIIWDTLQFERLWPAGLAALAAVALSVAWFRRSGHVFADMALITGTRRNRGLVDRLMPVTGVLLLLLLTWVMMNPSVVHEQEVEQRARDFVILVDTSRSMRHDTRARRDATELHYERRTGAFLEAVDDPRAIPFVARFELARESLFRFLGMRDADDRVALLYFNDKVFPVSALMRDIGFLTEQLGTMDDYVNWGTNIAEAVRSGLGLLERYPGDNRRTLILLTDAETRFTEDLEAQFARIANADVSFYLLWITADEPDLATDDAKSFLKLARSTGSVYTIRDPDAANLTDALADISLNEGYRYQEVRRSQVDLARPVREAVRWVLLAWLLGVALIWHPLTHRALFSGQTP
jgi:hypothetical protein